MTRNETPCGWCRTTLGTQYREAYNGTLCHPHCRHSYNLAYITRFNVRLSNNKG